MGCAGCSSTKDGSPKGCQSNGNCQTGGCNRKNTFDWLAMEDVYDPMSFNYVEVSFKNGARKEFFKIDSRLDLVTGDMVVVDAGGGFDVGRLNLSGEMVRMQMKKKRTSEEHILFNVIRKAHERDLEKLNDARAADKRVLTRARAISRTMELDMKIGDIEHRGDGRKATFYYTAEGRIDFRELVRDFAREFKVKVEMRQIGARQESARIGGLGSCGRELCCSTWLTDFKSVTTSAARYQNISINQSKLSGQCGRLKCCLNYELDTYMDALQEFPKNVDVLEAGAGKGSLIKTDIFKRVLYYSVYSEKGRGPIVAIGLDRVKEIKAMNVKGNKPEEFLLPQKEVYVDDADKDLGYADVTGEIELPYEKRSRGKRRKSRNSRNRNRPKNSQGGSNSNQKKTDSKSESKPDNNKPKENKRSNNPPKGNKPSGARGRQNKNRKQGPNKNSDSSPNSNNQK